MIKFGTSGHQVFRATSPCLEERSNVKEVENYLYTSGPMGIRLKLFFAQSFLAISALSTEQSQICVKNTLAVKKGRPVVADQSDPHFAPADLLVTTPTPSIETAAQENLMQKHKERVEKLPQPDRLIENLY